MSHLIIQFYFISSYLMYSHLIQSLHYVSSRHLISSSCHLNAFINKSHHESFSSPHFISSNLITSLLHVICSHLISVHVFTSSYLSHLISLHFITSHLQHRADDLAVSQDLGLKHLMFLEELHLGLQTAEVGFTVLRHLLHPLRDPLVSLTNRAESRQRGNS